MTQAAIDGALPRRTKREMSENKTMNERLIAALAAEQNARGYARGLAGRRLVPGRQTPAYLCGWHEGVWVANEMAALRKLTARYRAVQKGEPK